MIDIETDVYNAVKTKVREQYPGVAFSSAYVRTPAEFPFVSVAEMDNTSLVTTQDSSNQENHAVVMYEINAYSNKSATKKSECRAIAAAADEKMLALGFTRTMLNPIPNLDDASIYRMTGRYTAVVSKDRVIYRR